ncbi:T9SS type A sorting domain-containing protein [Winogradskyella sp.]|uniref:T9SS type A sorting domain-containing protein n=1 Tax=Winogradskyella sp. TaxID=1883156 RepID=UPI0025F141B8|nr:T9SS type A sorting domain-containing protein [Winogradskyella sp.]
MKHFYTLISLFIIISLNAQNYELAIVSNGNYNFSIVAIPDFDSSGNTDISDIGFALMVPTGNTDVANLSQFNGRTISSTEVTATVLSANGLGDGTRDGFLINLPPGQTLLSHTSGQQIVILSFDITNMPTTGQLEILTNTDPIAIGLGGSLNSFYNANIDSTTTQDYFGGIVSGQGNFMFDVLGIEDETLSNVDLYLYPNPTQDFAYIKTSAVIKTIEIYDITGKLVRDVKTKKLVVSDLNSGVYLLKIYTENTTIVRRLIKE